MTKFSIEYNPYLVSCIFKKNGKVLNENSSKIGAKSESRLQMLFGESVNWKGLPEEIAIACDDDEIEITFKGRKIDFDDLQYTFDLYKGSVKFKFVFEETRNDADVISSLDTVFAEIKQKDIPEFNIKNKDGIDIFDAYEEVKNGVFEVNVIATMSSGKSTLINSLLHTELLPSANKACTATIAKILDNDDMDEYEAECYAADGKTVVHPRSVVALEMMEKYNADESVTYINIEGNIPEMDSDKIRLCLRDTPGPNNAGNEKHGKLTRSIITRTNAVVLYVMNATQLEINDDKQLLLAISNEMKRAGKQSRDRFIFVVNKCDALDEQKGETIDKLLNQVREYLQGFNIVEPILIPTCASLALAIRKKRKGEVLTRKEGQTYALVNDFVTRDLLHYERYATLTPTVREYLQNEVDKYHADEGDWDFEALIHTGVPAVEQTIREYIDKYAYPIKIKDAIKDIEGILGELNMTAKFDKSIAEDSDKLRRVREQIESAKIKHKDSEKVYEEYKAKISNLKIDDLNKDDEQFKVENKLQEMTKAYDGKTKVDKVEADGLIAKFQDDLERFLEECEAKLNYDIKEKIIRKCVEMLEDYTCLVKSILADIEVEGYDFRKIYSFEKIKISNIDDIKIKNQQNRYRDEKRWKDNPERAGFWGWFKFWKPKEISYTVQVKDGIDVNVKNIIIDIMNTFSASIKDNISSMFKQTDEQIDEYKSVFNENIESLKDEITKILCELDIRTRQSEELEKRVADNKELAEWVEEKENKIKALLAF